MGTVKSVRRAEFKRQLQSLPPEIQRRARRFFTTQNDIAYRLFLQNPFHPFTPFKGRPSFRRRIIESTRHRKRPHWEFRITRAYRATCIIDDDTYIWVFIGHHRDFDRFYG